MSADSPEAPAGRNSTLLNGVLLFVSCCVALAVFEVGARYRFLEARAERPEVAMVQQYLQLNEVLGFTWKPNIDADENIVFQIADVTLPALSTDGAGFINPPAAKAARAAGTPVDVVGLGDSFIEGASHIFHERFRDVGLEYYNLAIHRHAPPQYAAAYDRWGQALNPKWVICGIFENDFVETVDYFDWRNSELDWFTYHSGTWCGPPIADNTRAHWFDRFLPGMAAAWAKLDGKQVDSNRITQGEWRLFGNFFRRDLAAISRDVEASGARLVLVLIPSKESVFNRPTDEWGNNRTLTSRVTGPSVVRVDLLPVFASAPDPRALYYEVDGHWNDNGIQLAFDTILEAMRAADAAGAEKDDPGES